ncbi:Concanavalin A-like lectin/glucanases superfamily protein [Chitinophaga costaii]|uniref:Concanavalin A-like lectin/glucanases superfamily protein n=1 Tax=Chitinophaga costaii TaxID=1335309 RepID=A0A1C4FUT0_9BACT|nr:LamG-like jellyroll fold domain-containing protein [Chitinophaga costaii]PUZ27211.1 hypothetical protein DCM91_08320 [Chitinophaga costaii]SCC59413.1 Concanavalin A-like lectin/glucanases superfamily protein [Chitinophaga costaii]
MKQTALLKYCYCCFFLLAAAKGIRAQTIALWGFDDVAGSYPSTVIPDLSSNDYPLVLGKGGSIVPGGRFGNAFTAREQEHISYPQGEVLFGLSQLKTPADRHEPPMSWMNANFGALMSAGENHLRKEVGFVNPTQTKLNLGNFDWTVECWLKPNFLQQSEQVIFEIGTGPRGENDRITKLSFKGREGFRFLNNGIAYLLPMSRTSGFKRQLNGDWHHFVLLFQHKSKTLSWYIDGRLQGNRPDANIVSLPLGEEAYFSIGRNGHWQEPLLSAIDELRFSEGFLYSSNFKPPIVSFIQPSSTAAALPEKVLGPPLLFPPKGSRHDTLKLGNRKFLFLDSSIIDTSWGKISFQVNPPLQATKVIEVKGIFRKHLNVLEDEKGLIRIYYGVNDDNLAVQTSADGLHFTEPDLIDTPFHGHKNIVVAEETGMGMVFIDPNAPPEQKWKFLSDFHRRGIYLYVSNDGWRFKRLKQPVLPFRSGSQSNIFYDDQQQLYLSYHRTDFGRDKEGNTQRNYVLTATEKLAGPWPYKPLSLHDLLSSTDTSKVHRLIPWYLDNGPLTPGGFGKEFPWVFTPAANDPDNVDIYVPKAIKYPWAPDTYLAFPCVYFHYESPVNGRNALSTPDRDRGSGPIETQLAISRNGYEWKRYPRPVYLAPGTHDGWPVQQIYMAQGLIRRGNEIWQYFYGTEAYHSGYLKLDKAKTAVYRVVQRLDGFVSLDASYDENSCIRTLPFTFEGDRLLLNVNTSATGYMQVGILDGEGRPLPGFGLDDCIYINGDYIETPVEWLKKGASLKSLNGKTVRLIFRMRGSKLYAMQFK